MELDITPGIFADPDFIRDSLEASFPCAKCGAREPARIGMGINGQYGCSECVEYPRCLLCPEWIDDQGRARSRALDNDGRCPVHGEG